MKTFKHQKHGFTLLEVLVAAGIILVLTAAGVGAYGNVNRRSRDARRTSDIEQIRQALEMYRADTGFYPAVNTGAFATAANLSGTLVPTYMPAVPADPRAATQPYQFQALNASGGNYYGYCLSARLEVQAGSTTCTVGLPTVGGNVYNYGQKSP